MRARFYNPTIGRFTQEDVYRDDGLNLYAYVINNPLLWVDPSGYTKCQRLSEEQVREIQRVADSYKVDGKKNNPYNWDARLLQQHIDAIHEAVYNTTKKNSVLQDGTPFTRDAYGNYGGNAPMAITVTRKGNVILSSNSGTVNPKAVNKAYEIFGEENVVLAEGKDSIYRPTEVQEKAVSEALQKQKEAYKTEHKLKKLPKTIEKKFGELKTNHAEVRGIQKAKDMGEANKAKQFCSHLSCPSCQIVQNMEGVINGTGVSVDNNYVYARDYTHIE